LYVAAGGQGGGVYGSTTYGFGKGGYAFFTSKAPGDSPGGLLDYGFNSYYLHSSAGVNVLTNSKLNFAGSSGNGGIGSNNNAQNGGNGSFGCGGGGGGSQWTAPSSKPRAGAGGNGGIGIVYIVSY
jgi:hypothetical protein